MKKLILTTKEAEKITKSPSSFWDEVTTNLKGGSDCFMTLQEIACEMKITRERVRQIETKAIRKLQHPKRSIFLKPFIYE